MVEVSPEVPSRMTPFCRCTKTGPGKAIPTKWYTFSLFQSGPHTSSSTSFEDCVNVYALVVLTTW